MKNSLFFLFLQILFFKHIHGIESFKYSTCYSKKAEERMPLSIDNLIAIIENYEKDNSNSAPEDVADALLNRYRINGIVYYEESNIWTVKQYEENYKQTIDDKLLKPSAVVPDGTLLLREECSLHMMLSHSIDYYPHAGADYIWENNYFSRRKRSYVFPNLPDDVTPADHPIEFGIIQTNAGPISGGLLLAGIMSSATTKTYTVKEIIGSDENTKLPEEMLTKTIEPLYGSTVSGILAKAAILIKNMNFNVAPIGMFGNSTACPRIYSLKETDLDVPYYLTRAEIFGALDGFIIGRYMQNKDLSSSVSLSEILRMYYSDHGLYDPDLRACNRKNIYSKYISEVSDNIHEQALNYMYAFQVYFPDVETFVEQNSEDVQTIYDEFESKLTEITSTVNSFITSYSYDDPGYYSCPTEVNNYNYETEADLVVVYTPPTATSDIEKQLEYIGLTARRIGVGYYRSRIAVLNGKSKTWLSEMTNYTNIADYVCNYTTSTAYSGDSSQSFLEILNKLSIFYGEHYANMKSNPDLTGRNSQVVLWTLPSKFDEQENDVMLREWNNFNLTYPDVTFIFVGSESSQTLSFLGGQKNDVVLISSSSTPIDISTDIVNEIKQAPRLFYYAACDTLVSEYSSYNEDNHVYSIYVSPNFSTIIKIPPQNFHYSKTVKLNMEENGFRVCLSRKNSQPSESDGEEETYCDDSNFEKQYDYLCYGNVSECQPIYISVTGKSDTSSSCSDDYCIYPNQIEFRMTHEGMICSSCLFIPNLLLLFFVLLIVIVLGI